MKKISLRGRSLKEMVSRKIKQRRGSSTISAIVISAIILIALVLLNTDIRTFISSMWTTFSTFIDDKLTTLFAS